MKRRAAWREHSAVTMIGLSLWMALPAFQWCSASPESCRIMATMSLGDQATSADSDCDIAHCPYASGCGAPTSSRSERVWCVGARTEVVAPREISTPTPDAPMLAETIEPAVPPAPVSVRARRFEPTGCCPGIVAAHAPPLTRAPPLS